MEVKKLASATQGSIALLLIAVGVVFNDNTKFKRLFKYTDKDGDTPGNIVVQGRDIMIDTGEEIFTPSEAREISLITDASRLDHYYQVM